MLKDIRQQRNLTQKQLHEKSEISIRTIQSYESNSRDINGASLSSLVKMALAMECKITDIISDQELIDNLPKVI